MPDRDRRRFAIAGGRMKRLASLLLILPAAFAAGAAPAAKPSTGDWVGWGNGPGYRRFQPADQINTANVSQLKPVWKYTIAQKGYWEITPIVVDGVMYLQDMEGNAIALDPETGREIWRFASGQAPDQRGQAAVARCVVDRAAFELLAQPPVRLAERVIGQSGQQMVERVIT